ncbi:MAG TPA: glycogen debranching enzyme, partial [Terriglobia bacterium]|nr:glycogen debranching enzyme [Terriglobia bacterium]
REIFQFARGALALRRAHPVLRREAYYTEDELRWFDPKGKSPDWFDARQKCLAGLIHGQGGPDLYLMFNADSKPVRFILPAARSGPWRLAADTTRPTPRDFYSPETEVPLRNPLSYVVESSSAVVLVAR